VDFLRNLEYRLKSLESRQVKDPNETSGPPSRQYRGPTPGYGPPGPPGYPDNRLPALLFKKAIPELKTMGWDEYKEAKGSLIPDDHYAIDILEDEPVIDLGMSRRRGKHAIDYAEAAKYTPSISAQRKEGLPSRIRINSLVLLAHLFQISKKAFGTTPVRPAGGALVILRPFKMLYYYEPEIKRLLSHLEAKLAEAGSGGSGKDNGPLQIETESNSNIAAGSEPANERPEQTAVDPFSEERLNGPEGVDVLRCLVRFIDEYLKPIQDAFDQRTRDKVKFSELYHLLKPELGGKLGKLACVKHTDFIQVWRIVQVTGGRRMPEFVCVLLFDSLVLC
jgi:hypothetical protein